MFARVFSKRLGSFVTFGVLLLCSAMAAAQEAPPLPAVETPPVIFAMEPPTAADTAPCSPVTRAPATVAWLPKEGKAVVLLKDGSQIRGTLDGLSAVEISTDFGQLTIPSKMIERVTLNQDVNLSTVEYKEDRLTGVIELPTLRMRTAWGDVSVREDQLKRFPPGLTMGGISDPYATPHGYAPAVRLTPIPPSPVDAVPYPAPSVTPASTAPPAPEKFRVQLEDKSLLVGDLRRPEEIRIKLAFAEIEVPVKSVSWLKRADGAAKVRLANGDRVSGVLMVNEWTIDGVLGTIRLDAKKVSVVRRGPARRHWITRPVTESTPGGGTVTRYVRELVEVFEDGPLTPATSWTTPALPGPRAYPAPPPASYGP